MKALALALSLALLSAGCAINLGELPREPPARKPDGHDPSCGCGCFACIYSPEGQCTCRCKNCDCKKLRIRGE